MRYGDLSSACVIPGMEELGKYDRRTKAFSRSDLTTISSGRKRESKISSRWTTVRVSREPDMSSHILLTLPEYIRPVVGAKELGLERSSS